MFGIDVKKRMKMEMVSVNVWKMYVGLWMLDLVLDFFMNFFCGF